MLWTQETNASVSLLPHRFLPPPPPAAILASAPILEHRGRTTVSVHQTPYAVFVGRQA